MQVLEFLDSSVWQGSIEQTGILKVVSKQYELMFLSQYPRKGKKS